MRPAQFTFAAVDRDGVAQAQTTAGATALTLNGALVPAIQPGLVAVAKFNPGINRTVSLYSAADLSGINFAITGFDASGNAVSESRVGPTAGATVYTTALFNKVASVTPDAAVGTAVEVGSGSTGATNWYAIDYFQGPISVGLWLKITSTIDVTVQMTPDAFLQTTATPDTFNHASLTNITADAASELPYGAQGVRALINSSSGGAMKFSIVQAGGYAG